jgi:hypothetical protein
MAPITKIWLGDEELSRTVRLRIREAMVMSKCHIDIMPGSA